MKLSNYYDPGPGMTNLELARAYILFQQYTESYSPEEALEKGTLFPELYRPYRRQ